jgi:hypothetical protein
MPLGRQLIHDSINFMTILTIKESVKWHDRPVAHHHHHQTIRMKHYCEKF